MPDELTPDSTEIPDEADDLLAGSPSIPAAAGEGQGESLYPREGCSAHVRKNVLCEECGEYHKVTAERMTARVRGGPGWR